jgi:hypothetical protein
MQKVERRYLSLMMATTWSARVRAAHEGGDALAVAHRVAVADGLEAVASEGGLQAVDRLVAELAFGSGIAPGVGDEDLTGLVVGAGGDGLDGEDGAGAGWMARGVGGRLAVGEEGAEGRGGDRLAPHVQDLAADGGVESAAGDGGSVEGEALVGGVADRMVEEGFADRAQEAQGIVPLGLEHQGAGAGVGVGAGVLAPEEELAAGFGVPEPEAVLPVLGGVCGSAADAAHEVPDDGRVEEAVVEPQGGHGRLAVPGVEAALDGVEGGQEVGRHVAGLPGGGLAAAEADAAALHEAKEEPLVLDRVLRPRDRGEVLAREAARVPEQRDHPRAVKDGVDGVDLREIEALKPCQAGERREVSEGSPGTLGVPLLSAGRGGSDPAQVEAAEMGQISEGGGDLGEGQVAEVEGVRSKAAGLVDPARGLELVRLHDEQILARPCESERGGAGWGRRGGRAVWVR